MNRTRTTRSLLALLLSFAGSFGGTESDARAEAPPSVWEAAGDPEARSDWKVHVAVQRKFASKELDRLNPLGELHLDGARALLEEAHAAEREGALLRFDLAEVYQAQSLHLRAAAVYEKVLRDAPDHPAAQTGRLDLAFCYAHLERTREERDAYHVYLRTAPVGHARAVALLNLAEAEMRLGNLREAIAGYHVAFDASGDLGPFDRETQVLAVWGLAVALDRSGDTKSAMREATLAAALDPGLALIAHGESVFFVPDYERNYYVALGQLAESRKLLDTSERELALSHAERTWKAYVNAAVPGDRWLPQAKRRLEDTTRELKQAHRENLKRAKRVLGPESLE